jgi:hypothetical protein
MVSEDEPTLPKMSAQVQSKVWSFSSWLHKQGYKLDDMRVLHMVASQPHTINQQEWLHSQTCGFTAIVLEELMVLQPCGMWLHSHIFEQLMVLQPCGTWLHNSIFE